jgi:uncharacterized protein (TIGR00251 family)
MIALEQHPQGVVIPVRVKANARRNGMAGEHDGMLRLNVTAAPEKGKANGAVAEILADVFEIAKSSVELVSGATNSQKRFLLVGVELGAAQMRLKAALAAGS